MAQPVWKSGNAAGSSWTIKGVQETTREAVREAAAQAELLIGDWVDQALSGAAQAALHPAPPPATKADLDAIVGEIAGLRAIMAEVRAAPREPVEPRVSPREAAESRAVLKELAELRAMVQGLVQHLERQERHERQERPVVRHVLVEQRKPSRLPPRRGGDKDERGP